MQRILSIVIAGILALPALAADEPQDTGADIVRTAEGADLNEFLWINRVVAVFADSPADPRFVQQMGLLEAGLAELADRDVIIVTDTAPKDRSSVRQEMRPRGFMLVLIGKDGTVYLRKPLPWSVREISRSIDKLPMRQQEVRDRRASR